MQKYKEIPIKQIRADNDFNARTSYDDVEQLAEQINLQGQLQAILVKEIPPDERVDHHCYFLVFGFRRIRALLSLGRAKVTARIWDGDIEESYFVNLSENIARKNLKPWEKAKRYSEIKNEFNISAREIAKRLSVSQGNVSILIKLWERGNPKILELWKQGHTKATTGNLNKFIVCDGFDHQTQWEAWLRHCGLDLDSDAATVEDAMTIIPRVRGRLRSRHFKAAMIAIQKSERPKAWKRGAESVLNWALGESETLEDIYDPNRRKNARKKEIE